MSFIVSLNNFAENLRVLTWPPKTEEDHQSGEGEGDHEHIE